jgi:hypothetical protein
MIMRLKPEKEGELPRLYEALRAAEKPVDLEVINDYVA